MTSVSAPPPATDPAPATERGRVGEVFRAFLRLGLTSFGGPIAHLGYFRDELVTHRRWVRDDEYAELVGLAQFLPGPASSQVGFVLGLFRAGPLGALAAWAAFTLPSAAVLVAFAFGAASLSGPIAAGMLHGLQVVAVAIVAQAVWGMARTLTPDLRRTLIAVGAAAVVLAVPGSLGHVTAIAAGALVGWWLLRGVRLEAGATGRALRVPVSRRAGLIALLACLGLLVALPLAAAAAGAAGLTGIVGRSLAIADVFSRAGALVFGGGHVLLPLLESEVVGAAWVSEAEFLAGYGAAQAVPGPLFTFAAYLGALAEPCAAGLITAAVALISVFLPGMLLLIGVLPFWAAWRRSLHAQALLRGANAAVVGILAAALVVPVYVSTVTDQASFALAFACFLLLMAFRVPAWAVVLVGAGSGALLALL